MIALFFIGTVLISLLAAWTYAGFPRVRVQVWRFRPYPNARNWGCPSEGGWNYSTRFLVGCYAAVVRIDSLDTIRETRRLQVRNRRQLYAYYGYPPVKIRPVSFQCEHYSVPPYTRKGKLATRPTY